MTNALTNTGMGHSRVSKGSAKGYFYINPNVPLLFGSGILLQYFALDTGQLVDPVKINWDSSRYGLKISASGVVTTGYTGSVTISGHTLTIANGLITTVA